MLDLSRTISPNHDSVGCHAHHGSRICKATQVYFSSLRSSVGSESFKNKDENKSIVQKNAKRLPRTTCGPYAQCALFPSLLYAFGLTQIACSEHLHDFM